MADFVIKPGAGSTNKLILQAQDETDVLTTSASGVAITAPTIGDLSNVTGTLPVGVTGGSGLTALASNPTVTLGSNATFPAGHVVQTKTGVYATQTQMNFDSNTWNSVGLSVTIVPIYANSKILVSWVCNVFVTLNDGNYGCGFRIGRTGPSSVTVWTTGAIGVYHYGSAYRSGTHQLVDTFAGSAIDLPASTDMCTYTALINDSAADYCEAQYNSAPTTIILQEIKV